MAVTTLHPTIRYLREVVGPPETGGLTDHQLLDRFVARLDHEAFATLVRRHGPLVLGVCRRVVGDAQEAEDSFQATFLVLARKAGTVRDPGRLGSWLYGVAYRTAKKARSLLARRRAHERPLDDAPANRSADDLDRREVRAVLDEEIQRLPGKYRTPLVLCYLQGQTNEQAARLLGCPKGTVAVRMARARDRLRQRLTARGLGLTAGALSALLAREASAALPLASAIATARAAASFAAGQSQLTGSSAALVTALTQEVLKGMVLTKLKLVVLSAAAVAMIGAGLSTLLSPFPLLGHADETVSSRRGVGDEGATVFEATRDVEEDVYTALRRDHCWRPNDMPVAIWVRAVEGRRLSGVLVRYRTGSGRAEIVCQAREAEVTVDRENKALVLHLRSGVVGVPGWGDRLTFENKITPIPLPPPGAAPVARDVRPSLQVGEFCAEGLDSSCDARTNKFWVQGAGVMQLLLANSLAGDRLGAPEMTTIHWDKTMLFNGQSAEFHGDVQVWQNGSRLVCEAMQVQLDRPVSLLGEQKAGPAVQVREMTCLQNVGLVRLPVDRPDRVGAITHPRPGRLRLRCESLMVTIDRRPDAEPVRELRAARRVSVGGEAFSGTGEELTIGHNKGLYVLKSGPDRPATLDRAKARGGQAESLKGTVIYFWPKTGDVKIETPTGTSHE